MSQHPTTQRPVGQTIGVVLEYFQFRPLLHPDNSAISLHRHHEKTIKYVIKAILIIKKKNKLI